MIVKGKKRHIIIIMKVPRDSQKQDVAVAQPVHDSNSNSSHYIVCAVLPIYYGKPCEQARGGGGDIETATTYNSAAKQGAPHMRRPAETPAAAA